MARMFPERLPRHVQEDPGRRGERHAYRLLDQQLDEQFHVFHSVAWLDTDSAGAPRDGEADFIVGHADFGLLVLEVKGGVVQRRGGTWLSQDRRGRLHKIKAPLGQARDAQYRLLRKLKRLPDFGDRWIPAGYAAILTDTAKGPDRFLGLDAPVDRFVFSDELDRLGERVVRLLTDVRNTDSAQSLGGDFLDALVSTLAPTFKLAQPLRYSLSQDDSEINLLTEDQFRVLQLLARQRRVAIQGPAGTGKTQLAIEKAVRLAREGQRVLLTCQSEALAAHLWQLLWRDGPLKSFRTAEGGRTPADEIVIDSYDQLSRRLFAAAARDIWMEQRTDQGPDSATPGWALRTTRRSDLAQETRAREDVDRLMRLQTSQVHQDIQNLPGGHQRLASFAPERVKTLPDDPDGLPSHERVFEAIRQFEANWSTKLRPFDAILVDEAQHLNEDDWTAIQYLLADQTGLLYAFLDEGQAWDMVDGQPTYPPEFATIVLTDNLRNTREIHRLATSWHPASGSVALGPEGQPVVFWEVEEADDAAWGCTEVLTELIERQSVDPGDIVILDGGTGEGSLWRHPEAFGDHQLTPFGTINEFKTLQPDPREVVVTTTAQFQGLERPVVVLTGLEGLTNERLLYIAVSRARVYLVLVGTAQELERLRRGLTDSTRDIGSHTEGTV